MMKYKWKTKPYKHQVLAVRKMLKRGQRGVALLMDPRTGKTKATIDWLSILAQAGKIDRAVIICPNRVIDVWVDEFHTHSPLKVNTFVWDKENRRDGMLPKIHSAFDLTVVIINYEAFGVPGRKLPSGRRSRASGRFSFRTKLQKWVAQQPAACVLDESHKIKSPQGRVANMIVSMRPLFEYRALLTGTPVTKAKRVFDIYMQWKFLNPNRFKDLTTVEQFKSHYGKWTKRNGYPQFLSTQNIDDLTKRIHKDSFAITRAECFDLPPFQERIISVPLIASAYTYDEMAEQMVAEIEHNNETHTVEASIKLVQTIRLRQITGGMATTDEGELIRIGSEKLIVLRELIEVAEEQDEKLVICANFKPDLDAIAALGREMNIPVFELRGGMKRTDTDNNIKKFRKIDDCSLFVMQPQAGSLGIDLSTSPHVVWYSLTPSFVNWSQSNDRIALSHVSTTFTYLLAEGTIDELMLETLKEDGDMARKIVKKPQRLLRKSRSKLR